MSDDEEDDEDKQQTDIHSTPPSSLGRAMGPSHHQPVPGHFSLLKRHPQSSEPTSNPTAADVKTSAAAARNTKHDAEVTGDGNPSKRGGKGSGPHAKQTRHHQGKNSSCNSYL